MKRRSEQEIAAIVAPFGDCDLMSVFDEALPQDIADAFVVFDDENVHGLV